MSYDATDLRLFILREFAAWPSRVKDRARRRSIVWLAGEGDGALKTHAAYDPRTGIIKRQTALLEDKRWLRDPCPFCRGPQHIGLCGKKVA